MHEQKIKLSIESSTCLDHREVDRLKHLKSEILPLEMLGAIERRKFCRVNILGEPFFADRITGTLYHLDGMPASGMPRVRIVFGAQPTGRIPRDVEDANEQSGFVKRLRCGKSREAA